MNKNYKYAGRPLTEKIARELVIEIFSGNTGIKKREIKRAVDEAHTSRGGRLSTNEVHPVSGVLSVMKKQGIANNPTRGEWSIFNPDVYLDVPSDSGAVRTLGSGKNAVYLFYYPAYRCLAECEGRDFWACKIDKVGSQVPTAMPEPPEIRLVFKTDDSENLEQTIHNVLKFRGKHIGDAPDGKWFMTSPNEVEEIYRSLVGSA